MLDDWQGRYALHVRSPARQEALQEAINQIGNLPDDLSALYQCSNGLSLHWFTVLPLYDSADVKHTWNSLQRANNPQTTRFLEADETLIRRFIVFASLDAGRCAVIDRSDSSLWYEEEDQLHQTSMPLREFIETCLREVTEL